MRPTISHPCTAIFVLTVIFLGSIGINIYSLYLTSHLTNNDQKLKALAKEYYAVYEERRDFDRFLSFYDEHIVLQDIINGDRIEGKEKLMQFFDWNNLNFKKIGKGPSRVLEELAIDKNQIIAKGYLAPFEWYGIKYEAMYFTTWLLFNEQGKIIKHIDWINYPNTLVDYNTRKNANDWISIPQNLE